MFTKTTLALALLLTLVVACGDQYGAAGRDSAISDPSGTRSSTADGDAEPAGEMGLELEYVALTDLVADVEVIVSARVVEVKEAHLVGDPEAPVAKEHVTLSVEEVLHGVPEYFAEDSLLVQQPDLGASFNGVPGLAADDRVVLFLKPLCGEGKLPVYYRVNTQGVYYFDGAGQSLPSDRMDPLAMRLAELDMATLVDSVSIAQEGSRQAQPPLSPPTARPDQVLAATADRPAASEDPGCTSSPFE